MSTSENQYSFLNIDFAPIASVANSLLDKLEHAIGWVAIHDTPNRHAIQYYISEIEKSDEPPLIKAAKISNAKKDIKHYINQYKIVSQAAAQLSSKSNPSGIDDDWLDLFMDKARLVSSEEMQAIWSRVLSQECESPGAFSLQLLNILSVLPRNLAEKFLILCGFSVCVFNDYSLIVDLSDSDYYRKHGLSFNDVTDLSSIGLIYMSDVRLSVFNTDSESSGEININGQTFYISYPPEKGLPHGMVSFTNCGKSLFSIMEPKVPDDFIEYCLNYWKLFPSVSIIPAS